LSGIFDALKSGENDMQLVQTAAKTSERTEPLAARWAAFALILMGAATVYCLGFSNLPRAHAATHDTRHASGFPCH
jgi:cobalt transporter subunit CbtB